MPTKTEVAWAAGLFEGEGTLFVRPPRGRGRTSHAAIALGMKDRDVVERFAAIVECGSIRFQARNSANPLHSDMWYWGAGKRVDVLRVATMLLPYLGERRAAMAREVVEAASRMDGRTLRYQR